MINWFTANLATILITLVIAIIVALVIIHIVKNKKQGKNSCGCGCGNCPMSGSCKHHSDINRSQMRKITSDSP